MLQIFYGSCILSQMEKYPDKITGTIYLSSTSFCGMFRGAAGEQKGKE